VVFQAFGASHARAVTMVSRRSQQRPLAATADHFDDAALAFWDGFGSGTVNRLGST